MSQTIHLEGTGESATVSLQSASPWYSTVERLSITLQRSQQHLPALASGVCHLYAVTRQLSNQSPQVLMTY